MPHTISREPEHFLDEVADYLDDTFRLGPSNESDPDDDDDDVQLTPDWADDDDDDSEDDI